MSDLNRENINLNSTIATLLNLTTTETYNSLNTTISSGTLTSWNGTSWNNTSWNNTSWNNTYWNNSIWDPNINGVPWNPYCPGCVVPTDQPPLVSYTYTYIYYVLLLLLLCVAIVCIKLGIARRNELQRRAAGVQRRTARPPTDSPYGSTNNCNNPNTDNSCHMGPKEFDLPPAYDDVMQSYLLAKQLEAQENGNSPEGAIGSTPSSNNLTTSISTLTIETDIGNSNHASTLDLNNPTTSSTTSVSTTVTTSAIVNLPPPSYEYTIETSNAKITQDHHIV